MREMRNTVKKTGIPALTPGPEGWWPETFAPPRTAVFMAASAAALLAMMFGAASLGALSPVKTSLALLLDFSNPIMISRGNYDLAAVVSGLGLVMLGGIVHPSVGLAALMLMRPWIDGYTFKPDNFYFSLGVYFLAALWAARTALRGGPVRGLGWLAPLALFFLIALAGLATTWQAHATGIQLMRWFSFIVFLLLTVNAADCRAARGLLLAALLTAGGAQALFSILHYEYLLPFLRNRLTEDPRLLMENFGTDKVTPELARRFNINRAFGTMLFPNSLGAYLALVLPLSAAGLAGLWGGMRAAMRDRATIVPATRRGAMAATVAVWLAVALTSILSAQFPVVFRATPLPWYLSPGALLVISLAAGAVPGLWTLFFLQKHGWRRYGLTAGCAALGLALLLELWALWVTYSRGAMLALAAAAVWTLLLWWLSGRRALLPKWLAGAAALLLCLCALALTGHGMEAGAQQPAAPHQSNEITMQGVQVGAQQLMDPASFRVRITYWRVGLSIFLDNFWTGVGLGNFPVAYPQYQYLGAGDVQEAHNSFLQMFIETGVFGGLCFLGFWAALFCAGALRILRGRGEPGIFWVAGLYCGLLAFCLHALIDINFSHPSLVMIVMVFAGLLVGRPSAATPVNTPPTAVSPVRATVRQAAAVALLVALALASGLGARVWLRELCLGRLAFMNMTSEQELMRRMQLAQYFVTDYKKYADAFYAAQSEGKPTPNPPKIPFADALLLMPDVNRWATFEFYAPLRDAPGKYRPMQPGERPALSCMIGLNRPGLALKAALEGIEAWTAELERIDSRFPHDPELAMHIAQWRRLLAENVFGPKHLEDQPRWRAGYYDWSERAHERDPKSAEMEHFYAEMLVYKAVYDSDTADRTGVMADALGHIRSVAEKCPNIPGYLRHWSFGLAEMARLLRASGNEAEAAQYARQSEKLKKDAEELQQKRWNMGMPL